MWVVGGPSLRQMRPVERSCRRLDLQEKIRLVALTPKTLGVGCNGLGEEGISCQVHFVLYHVFVGVFFFGYRPALRNIVLAS